MLIGCAGKEPVVVTKYELVGYNIPSKLLKDCELTKPVSELDYLRMTVEERERVLVGYIVTLYSDVNGCNDLTEELRKYINDKESTR